MLSVTIGTNTNRIKVSANPDSTPKEVLQENDVDYSTANVHLDGSSLNASEMNTSLNSLGITESCMLIAVIKADNAA